MKHNLLFVLILFMVVSINNVNGQGVSINEDGSDPATSAILDLKSTTKGILIPRMTTTEIIAILQPADGLQVYNTDDGKLYIYVISTGMWKEISFGTGTLAPNYTCGDPLYDYRDGQSYATVDINGKCWMAENLNYGTKIDPYTSPTNNELVEKHCYSNNPANCVAYGGLYTWDEMMQYTNTQGAQGICPPLWHIPTDNEWYQMETFLDPQVVYYSSIGWRGYDIGGKLKEAGYTHWNGPNTGATNSSGMTILGAGIRNNFGNFLNLKIVTVLMTSTESYAGSPGAYARQFEYNKKQSYRNSPNKTYSYSVRCVKN